MPPPPPLQPTQTVEHPLWSHIGWGRPPCLDHHKINTCGNLNILQRDLDDSDCGCEAEESVGPQFFEDPDLHGMAHVMRESPHAPHTLIASVTPVNVPPPCSIMYEDWEPYYADDPDPKVLLDWGIKKTIEYGTYRWREPQWGHPHIRVDGRAVVPVAIKVIEAVHYFAHPGIPKTLELLKRQFHVRNVSEDDLRDRVKEVVDACVVCASPRQEEAHILSHVSPSPCLPIPLHQWQWTLYPCLKLNILKQG